VVVYQADFDRDGMADNWERQFGFATNNAADALQDADGDGMLNSQEYVAGTDPTNALSRLRIEAAVIPGGAAITMEAVSNRTYTVLQADDPGTGPWLRLVDIPARSTNHLETLFDFIAASNQFYRVVTPRQP
jgi:hypothetical protein